MEHKKNLWRLSFKAAKVAVVAVVLAAVVGVPVLRVYAAGQGAMQTAAFSSDGYVWRGRIQVMGPADVGFGVPISGWQVQVAIRSTGPGINDFVAVYEGLHSVGIGQQTVDILGVSIVEIRNVGSNRLQFILQFDALFGGLHEFTFTNDEAFYEFDGSGFGGGAGAGDNGDAGAGADNGTDDVDPDAGIDTDEDADANGNVGEDGDTDANGDVGEDGDVGADAGTGADPGTPGDGAGAAPAAPDTDAGAAPGTGADTDAAGDAPGAAAHTPAGEDAAGQPEAVTQEGVADSDAPGAGIVPPEAGQDLPTPPAAEPGQALVELVQPLVEPVQPGIDDSEAGTDDVFVDDAPVEAVAPAAAPATGARVNPQTADGGFNGNVVAIPALGGLAGVLMVFALRKRK